MRSKRLLVLGLALLFAVFLVVFITLNSSRDRYAGETIRKRGECAIRSTTETVWVGRKSWLLTTHTLVAPDGSDIIEGFEEIRVSPDSGQAVVVEFCKNPHSKLHVVDLKLGKVRHTLELDAFPRLSEWDAEGRRIAFCIFDSFKPIKWRVDVLDCLGDVDRRTVFQDVGIAHLDPQCWAPDGMSLAFVVGTKADFGPHRLLHVTLSGEQPVVKKVEELPELNFHRGWMVGWKDGIPFTQVPDIEE